MASDIEFRIYSTDTGEPTGQVVKASAYAVAPLMPDDPTDTEVGLYVSLDGVENENGEPLYVSAVIPERIVIAALARLAELRETQPERFVTAQLRGEIAQQVMHATADGIHAAAEAAVLV